MTNTPKHGHAPIAMRRRSHLSRSPMFELERVGDFRWGKLRDSRGYFPRALIAAIPTPPDAHLGWLDYAWEVEGEGARWTWDGDEDKPTLEPSLHAIGVWHGWARDGKLIEA